MKGTIRSNLYYYNGSTVIGVVAMVSSSGEDSKITSLGLIRVVRWDRHDLGKGH